VATFASRISSQAAESAQPRTREERAIAFIRKPEQVPFDESDADDYRPDSRWAVLVDPAGSGGHVDDITLIVEEIAPGDRIPLHAHPINEVIAILEGIPTVTLGDETRELQAGSVVFVPAGVAHGTDNRSPRPVRLHAMFPSEQIGIAYLERNPAPGTEGDAPQPALVIDARALGSSQ
jgi:quercetin dioxygenase-like cupin family protein